MGAAWSSWRPTVRCWSRTTAALSRWLRHTNRRAEGSWSQRYEHGVPVTDLVAVPDDGSIGTTVHFLPDADLTPLPRALAAVQQWITVWPHLVVDLRDHRP